MAKVIVMIGDRVLREIHVGKQTIRIGRDASNDVQLENPAVSRFHAEIYRQEHPFFVEDKNSTNGTFVNGSRIRWKSGLRNNDRITIGRHTLVFKVEPSDLPDGRIMTDIDGTLVIDPEK
ncbi:MAG: FHA domain-containing protein [bacterium]|nr:MAG: FHA domain-containing protein [bacterium]